MITTVPMGNMNSVQRIVLYRPGVATTHNSSECVHTVSWNVWVIIFSSAIICSNYRQCICGHKVISIQTGITPRKGFHGHHYTQACYVHTLSLSDMRVVPINIHNRDFC